MRLSTWTCHLLQPDTCADALHAGAGTLRPAPTQPLEMPPLCLAGYLPEQHNATVNLDLSSAAAAPGGGALADFTAWPEFHNGVAAGAFHSATPSLQALMRWDASSTVQVSIWICHLLLLPTGEGGWLTSQPGLRFAMVCLCQAIGSRCFSNHKVLKIRCILHSACSAMQLSIWACHVLLLHLGKGHCQTSWSFQSFAMGWPVSGTSPL